jgi:hypothetical protein
MHVAARQKRGASLEEVLVWYCAWENDGGIQEEQEVETGS